jgi:DNA repair protein RecN (Recombination protein N)
MERQLRKEEENYILAAGRLASKRIAASRKLVPAVERQFKALALKKASFGVDLSPAGGDEILLPEGGGCPLRALGGERAEFMLAANPGEPPRPLRKSASGGELSRVMLALHMVMENAAADRILVFDEVDAGIGGAVADAVGSRLSRLARSHQVLCVTHLPQVAAYADHHLAVSKGERNGRTLALIRDLTGKGRIDELARMLGGRETTRSSLRHASELLGAATRARGER